MIDFDRTWNFKSILYRRFLSKKLSVGRKFKETFKHLVALIKRDLWDYWENQWTLMRIIRPVDKSSVRAWLLRQTTSESHIMYP